MKGATVSLSDGKASSFSWAHDLTVGRAGAGGQSPCVPEAKARLDLKRTQKVKPLSGEPLERQV